MTERPGIIYLAVCRVNGKAYVGQTTYDIGVRVASHHSKRNTTRASYFQRAIGKYGIRGFDFAITGRCQGKAALNESEREWISSLGSQHPHGYNLSAGGEGSLAGKRSAAWYAAVRSPDVRRKHSERAKRWRANMTEIQRIEHQAKITKAATGREIPGQRGDNNVSKRPEVRAKISASKIGKPRSADTRAKLARAALAFYANKRNAS